MTQKELIEFCKENDPNYNKDASFKVLEPMWSIPKGIGGLGITESEFKNGFYIRINTKGRKGFEHLESKIFYFKIDIAWRNTEKVLYNSHWKKYFVPLDDLENWGREITKQVIEEPKLCDTYKEKISEVSVTIENSELEKQRIEQFKDYLKAVETPSENLLAQICTFSDYERMPENTDKAIKGIKPVEEFPIVKTQGKTTYSKRNSFIIIGKVSNQEETVVSLALIEDKGPNGEDDYYETTYSKQEFSDLVDLMIEARKDLLK